MTGNFVEPLRRLVVKTYTSEAESSSIGRAQLSDPAEPRAPDVVGSPGASAARVRLICLPPDRELCVLPCPRLLPPHPPLSGKCVRRGSGFRRVVSARI